MSKTTVTISKDTMRLLQAFCTRVPEMTSLFSAPANHAAKNVLNLFTILADHEKEGLAVGFAKKGKMLRQVTLAGVFTDAATAYKETADGRYTVTLGSRNAAKLEAVKAYLVEKGAVTKAADTSEVLAGLAKAAHQMLDIEEETGGSLALQPAGKAKAFRRHISGYNY